MLDNFNNNFNYILLDTIQAAKLLNCTKRKLESDRIKGGGIRYIKIGKCVRYNLSDIESYIQNNTVNSTSQSRGL
jgi:excisionase family DNA binding protein